MKFRIERLKVGAEVVGLEPGAESSPAVAKQLYSAWLDHGMLLFRGVDSIARHLSLSRVFGELEMHRVPAYRDPEEPLLMALSDDSGPAHVYDETDLRRGRLPWHRDTAYDLGIAKGGMLRMRNVPELYGGTLFADTAAAYDELPAQVKAQIATLEYKASFHLQFQEDTRPGSLWKTTRLATVDEYPENETLVPATQKVAQQDFPPVVHPIVTRHPESLRECLFISPKDAECIVGLARRDGDHLLDYLVGHMTKERYVYKHDWSLDDAIIWDNRRMLHAAEGYRVDQHRWGQRTTLEGRFDVGRPFYPTTDAGDGQPLAADVGAT